MKTVLICGPEVHIADDEEFNAKYVELEELEAELGKPNVIGAVVAAMPQAPVIANATVEDLLNHQYHEGPYNSQLESGANDYLVHLENYSQGDMSLLRSAALGITYEWSN